MLDVWQQSPRHNGRDDIFQISKRFFVSSRKPNHSVQGSIQSTTIWPITPSIRLGSQVGWSRPGKVNSVLLKCGRLSRMVAQRTPSKFGPRGTWARMLPGADAIDKSNKPLARVEMQHDVGQWGVVLSSGQVIHYVYETSEGLKRRAPTPCQRPICPSLVVQQQRKCLPQQRHYRLVQLQAGRC